MGQRQAEVELIYLEYIVLSGSDRRWRFKAKSHTHFDQLLSDLIKVRLFQIREVYFTLTSGDYAKKHAYEIHDDGMWFLSHFFANWEEMFEKANVHTSRTSSQPLCRSCGQDFVKECSHCRQPFCERCYNAHWFDVQQQRQQQEQATYTFHFTNEFFRNTFRRESTQGTFTQTGGIPAEVRTAHVLLGITTDKPTEEEIRAAFRTKARAIHPDTGGRGGDMDTLTKAKERALRFARVK